MIMLLCQSTRPVGKRLAVPSRRWAPGVRRRPALADREKLSQVDESANRVRVRHLYPRARRGRGRQGDGRPDPPARPRPAAPSPTRYIFPIEPFARVGAGKGWHWT